MDLNISDLLKAIPQSPLESMQKQQAFDQNRERLKALIEQAQLGNQASKLKMPFVAPNEQAKLRDLLAASAYKEAETKYVPTKYSQAAQRISQEAQNLDIKNRINSPEQLAALLALRQANARMAPTRGLTPEGKSILEQQRISQGMSPTGQGQLGVTPERQQQLQNAYELQRVKRDTDAGLRAAFPQIESIDRTLESIPFETVSQFFGPAGQLRAAKEFAIAQTTGKVSPEYQSYRDFLTTSGPGTASQMRNFLKDSVQAGAQEHLKSIVFPKKWTSNPEMALNQFHALQKLYGIEKQARVRAANDPTLYLGLDKKQQSHVNKLNPFPSFSGKDQEKQWYLSQTPEAQEAYLQYRTHAGK